MRKLVPKCETVSHPLTFNILLLIEVDASYGAALLAATFRILKGGRGFYVGSRAAPSRQMQMDKGVKEVLGENSSQADQPARYSS